jgi:26S proteasome regulatory subunit N5
MPSTASLLTLLVTLCWDAGDLDALNAQLTIMSKKHGQLKEAVVRMVDTATPWLADLKAKRDAGAYKGGKDRWLELLTTIRDITEGKIYLELQRARLTVMLSEYHEQLALTAPKADPAAFASKEAEASTGKDAEKKEPVTAEDHLDIAADLISEIQIETYSSMEKREKTEL